MAEPPPHNAHPDRTESAQRHWFRVEQAGDCVLVVAGGEVDLQATADLQQAVQHALRFTGVVVVDLSEVTFLDSAGVEVLVTVARIIRRTDHSLAMVFPTGPPREMLAVTGVDQALPIYGTRAQAIEAVSDADHG